ncbi:hypothetical protein CMALT430_190107 [Carnobacterium maltaromaticum]|nr:hypothetical protein CMALT430_190107 [Carnobacterium maltaromaticum]CAD5898692.1 hypothetical protein CMALT394_230019 [Carnobacterium maltaromaticum]
MGISFSHANSLYLHIIHYLLALSSDISIRLSTRLQEIMPKVKILNEKNQINDPLF